MSVGRAGLECTTGWLAYLHVSRSMHSCEATPCVGYRLMYWFLCCPQSCALRLADGFSVDALEKRVFSVAVSNCRHMRLVECIVGQRVCLDIGGLQKFHYIAEVLLRLWNVSVYAC